MNWRKNMSLMVGGGVAVVIAGLAGFMLFRYQSSYAAVNRQLKDATDKYDQLNHRAPYPSNENLEAVQKDRDAVKAYLAKVQSSLILPEIAPERIEPAEFALLLQRTLTDMRSRFSKNMVKIPDGTSLAFDRYTKGELPNADAIPRLVAQVKIIRSLVSILVDEKIDELVDVKREIFENAPVEGENAQPASMFTSGQGGGKLAIPMPPPESNDLYQVERIMLSFKANEHACWEVLNALASSKLFAVVSHVEFVNDAVAATATTTGPGEGEAQNSPSPAPGTPAAGPDGQPATQSVTVFPSREERIVGGREPVQVDLIVDVYRFAEQPKPEGAS